MDDESQPEQESQDEQPGSQAEQESQGEQVETQEEQEAEPQGEQGESDGAENTKRRHTMDNYITRAEHTEFSRRIEAEHKRIGHRLESVEDMSKEIRTIGTSVEKLAMSIQQLVETQKKQSEQIATLESRDGEKWRTVVQAIITMTVGGLVTYFLTQLGL